MLRKPELLSPAGHWPQLRAAIEAGADAVYFGLDHFSARAKVGFQIEELPQLMGTLHDRGVKGFVTFNTLVFDDELEKAETAIAQIAASGADAVIVQDIGIAEMIRDIVPGLAIHGSTQMSVTSAEGCELAKSFGCERVVLARELSLADIKQISQATQVELETFVHGALCVSYSGQCFSSEAWGGRSANRGQCAQACRLSYDLIVDGIHRELGDSRYLLSPGDLYALEQIPELMKLGVACFKIEGRYKDENYVALTTQAYRERIDQAWEQETVAQVDPQRRQELEQIYSRGLHASFVSGVNHQAVVDGRAPRHRGIRIGQVSTVGRDSVVVGLRNDLVHEIKKGDGLVFDAADWRSPDEPEEGGNVYQVKTLDRGQVRLSFAKDHIDFSRIRPGDWVWRTMDPQLIRSLRPIARPKTIQFSKPITIHVEAEVDQPLRITVALISDIENANEVVVQSELALSRADNQALSFERLFEQFGRLGDSPFCLDCNELTVQGPISKLFLPISQLNLMRRKMVEQLKAGRRSSAAPIRKTAIVEKRLESIASNGDRREVDCDNHLHVLVRSADQLDSVIDLSPASITLDYLELYGLRPSVEKIQSAGIVARVASPRILKPSEQKVIRFLLSLNSEIVIRSGGLLFQLLKEDRRPRLVGDFSLNVANSISADRYLQLGLDSITPGYDLNARQIKQLCRLIDPQRLETIVYSHLPVFHTEHCVFCRFLSEGTDHTNCGHPCESHQVQLRDPKGRLHPVMADVGCRNTVFGGEAQIANRFLNDWMESGVRDFRLEFVQESSIQTRQITMAYQQALDGQTTIRELESQVGSLAPSGTTLGSYFVPLQDVGRA